MPSLNTLRAELCVQRTSTFVVMSERSGDPDHVKVLHPGPSAGMLDQQHEAPAAPLTGIATALPRGALPAQHAAAVSCPVDETSLNTGMLPRVWNCSQAMPCGS